MNNHEIDWEGAKIPERESDWRMRKTKEAIQIRTEGAVITGTGGRSFPGSTTHCSPVYGKLAGKPRESEPRVRRSHASRGRSFPGSTTHCSPVYGKLACKPRESKPQVRRSHASGSNEVLSVGQNFQQN